MELIINYEIVKINLNNYYIYDLINKQIDSQSNSIEQKYLRDKSP
jgi:hypothetical protein